LTKEELNEIHKLNKEIKMWQRELNKAECKSLIKAQVITGMPFGTGISDPTFEIVAERDRYIKIIEGILCKIQISRNNIMNFIETIPDSITRQIFFYRCVSNLNWYQVAASIGDGYTADAVKQTYYRYLKNRGIK
jgi:hypothetical protein